MNLGDVDVVVAGHLCLDIIPTLPENASLPGPGGLMRVGPALFATGGAVANTGLALHRLGTRVRLVGKVGSDAMGRIILELLRHHEPGMTEHMVVSSGESSSYTIVISPPGSDRRFLHHPGTNDTFSAAEIRWDALRGAGHFHFGYPPLMKRMYADGGIELASIFERAKREGMSTSLDLAMPDPATDAGTADWNGILKPILPHVDLFMPSFDELFVMTQGHPAPQPTAQALKDLAKHFSVPMLAIKLGTQGLYLRTREREQPEWRNRELLAPCYTVDVVGTTGAGDCTIAGFLAGFLSGLSPEETLRRATAAGACCVEALDATSGVPPWPEIEPRITRGWPQRQTLEALKGWTRGESTGVWTGPENGR